MLPRRGTIAERFRALLAGTLGAVAIVALIAGTAYVLDRLRVGRGAATAAMSVVAALICIAVFSAGTVVASARARRDARIAARESAEWQARRVEALARRRAELANDPDPARRRYVAAIDRGELLDDDEIARRETRIAELRAHADGERYVERVFAGERITDRAIAYWSDRAMLVLCEHLQCVEVALRALDEGMTPHEGPVVETRRAIHWPLLRERHALPTFVELQPAHPRSEDGDAVHCTRCDSTLLTGFDGIYPDPHATATH